MVKVKAPARLRLYCKRCEDVHIFSLRGWGTSYYGACYEVNMPESLLNQALGQEITIHTLLAMYSSVLEHGYEELLPPLHTLV